MKNPIFDIKNKTNHPISSNSHPSATANTAIHSLKGGRGFTKPTETSFNFDKVRSGTPDGRLGKIIPRQGC